MSNTPQIQGLTDLLARLQAAPQNITSAVSAELADGAKSIAGEAKQRAPADQGILRNLISVNKVDVLNFEVVSGASYSAYIEFGTGEHVDIPAGLEEYAAQFQGNFTAGAYSEGGELTFKEAIFAWCKRKGIDKGRWYAIYVSIGLHGSPAHPFFFPAAQRQTPIIVSQVEKAVGGAI